MENKSQREKYLIEMKKGFCITSYFSHYNKNVLKRNVQSDSNVLPH